MSKELGYINSISKYIKEREKGLTREEIQEFSNIDVETSYTWELSFQCYKNNISLDKAIDFILKKDEITNALEQSMDALAHISNELLNPFNGAAPKIVETKLYEEVSVAYRSINNILFPDR